MNNKVKIIVAVIIIAGIAFGIHSCSKMRGDAENGKGTMGLSASVSIMTAKKETMSDNISISGTIVADNDVIVISETQGRVVKVDAEVGDYKQAGAVLIEVDSELKEAAYKAAKVTYEKAKKDLGRYESLYKAGSISETQIEQARWTYQSAESQFTVAQRQYNDTKITTPISGIVTARYVNLGSMVMGAPQATQIAEVVDISRLKVKVNIAEKDVFRLKPGDKVIVTTDVFPGVEFAGKISTISSKGDEGHTYAVEVVLKNTSRKLKAGMFGRVVFTPGATAAAVIIPREAIIGSVKDASIFVIENNVAKLRPVVTGKEFGTSVQILEGLREGDTVVVNGQNNLSDNTPVIIRN